MGAVRARLFGCRVASVVPVAAVGGLAGDAESGPDVVPVSVVLEGRVTAASTVWFAACLAAAVWVLAVSASVRSCSVRSVGLSREGGAVMPVSAY